MARVLNHIIVLLVLNHSRLMARHDGQHGATVTISNSSMVLLWLLLLLLLNAACDHINIEIVVVSNLLRVVPRLLDGTTRT